jgi:hypothetical protein
MYEIKGDSREAIGKSLNRTIMGIDNKIERMRLKRGGDTTLPQSSEVYWTKKEIQMLKDDCALNKGIMKTASHIGRSVGSVANKASRLGLTFRSDKWTAIEVNMLITKYVKNIPLADVAASVGRSASQCSQKAHQLGLKRPNRRISLPKNEIIEKYDSGMRYDDIAKEHGVSQSLIKVRLMEWGIKPRPTLPLANLKTECFVNPIPLEDKKWLACAIDAEGSLMFKQRESGPFSSISVSNTDINFLKECESITGVGSINTTNRPGHYKTCYKWGTAAAIDVLAILQQIQPYLIIKGDIANQMITACEEKLKKHGIL